MTRQAVHEGVYLGFIRKFKTLKSVARARESSLAIALSAGGLGQRKAKLLKRLATEVFRLTGKHSLTQLEDLPDERLESLLTSLPGVGKKVARCVMLYAFGRRVFPVDTHCWRVGVRLGLLGRDAGELTSKGMDRLQAAVPRHLRYSLHVNLVSHGRIVCIAGRPRCEACCVSSFCPTSSVAGSRWRPESGRLMKSDRPELDIENRDSILRFAEWLVGRTLSDVVPGQVREPGGPRHRGDFGNLVEEHAFGVTPNNRPTPDLEVARVEIKTAPLIDRPRAGRVPKERVVLGKIDYFELPSEEFATSKFIIKNQCLLLLFYLWERGVDPFEYEFIRSILHEFPPEDLEVIRRDWQLLRQKVRDGRAHEISEGDTNYLGACTKADLGSTTCKQPFSETPAQPRAFALKAAYLKTVFQRPPRARALVAEATKIDFRTHVLELLKRYEGVDERELLRTFLGQPDSTAKNRYRLLVNRMLDIPADAQIEEFEKADVLVKTVRVEPNGSIKESMSFRQIDFFELQENDVWEDSEFYADLARPFLFCVFSRKEGEARYRYSGAFFWTMPPGDLMEAEAVWRATRELAGKGRFSDFPKRSQTRVAHVNTHGKNKKDVCDTPHGGRVTKRSFWLNRAYVLGLLRAHGY